MSDMEYVPSAPTNGVTRPKVVKDRLPGFLGTDSREYVILAEACRAIRGVPGLTCEIGVRQGGSSQWIMKHCVDNGDRRIHIGIDPFGDLPYLHWQDRVEQLGYCNEMRRKMMADLTQWCFEHKVDFHFFTLTDADFFERFAAGVPVYDGERRVVNAYALVFFDGPHGVQAVRDEIDFFEQRTPIGGVWVFDDIDQYPHMEHLDAYVLSLGFETMKRGECKIAYRRITKA
jgi:hypothetical protein